MSNTAQSHAVADVVKFDRHPSKWLEASELRGLLKQNLGYSSKQVSVSARNSRQYLTVTVRDPKVDLARVEAFAKSLSTWSMAMDNVVTGQSITVTTTGDVDDAHAAPFVEEAFEIAFAAREPGFIRTASNGVFVMHQGFDFVVSRGLNGNPRFGGSRDSAMSKRSKTLALAIARA